MTEKFQPKTEEIIKTEVLEDLGVEYDGNEEQVDRVVARRLKDEEFKASVHKDKMDTREKLKETRKLAGLDPETGEKVATKVAEEPKGGDTTPKNDMSLKDIRALNDVPDEDIDDVIEFAKFKCISIAEAKSNPIIKTLLKTKAEERQSAQVANTGGTKRVSTKTSDDKILERIEKADESLTDEEMRIASKKMVEDLAKR